MPTLSELPNSDATPAGSSSTFNPTSILLPTPTGPQAGTTPQPQHQPEESTSSSIDPSSSKPKARLVGPEIVQLPPDPYALQDDDSDESEDEPDDNGGAKILGEDGQPKERDMLRKLPDETDDLELTHLQLENDSLLPLSLPRFAAHLKRLCLRQNRITALEPAVFEALTELEELDLYDNRIAELRGFEKCTKLKTLDFSYNLLRTLLPASSSTPPLSALPQLETVYFIQNKLSRIEGLDGVANTLRSLELGGNRIREIKGIEKLVNLEELWLGKNKIRKLENLSTLKKLKILSIQSNRITAFENLEGLGDSLEELYISHNGLSSLKGLEELHKLRVLDVGANRIEKIEALENAKGLEEFWANNNFIPNVGSLSHLEKHAALETVYLEGNPCETNDRSAYRRKVMLALPQLRQIDATFVC